MYGSVLSGALSGHAYGTAGWDITTTGEPAGIEGARPFFWETLRYASGGQMQWMAKFVLSEGRRYQDLLLGSADISPKQAPDSQPLGIDGWSYMMRTRDKDFTLVYFEHKALRAKLSHFPPNAHYRFTWYDPRKGTWLESIELQSAGSGQLQLPPFPDAPEVADLDWAAKLLAVPAK
jgi:hypothetical protein